MTTTGGSVRGVVQAHPLGVLPPVVVAVVVGASAGPGPARIAFAVAAGAALCSELTSRMLVRRAWAARLWPPSVGDPVAGLAVLAALLWAATWAAVAVAVGTTVSSGLWAGVLGGLLVAAVQTAVWVAAARFDPLRSRRPWSSVSPRGRPAVPPGGTRA